MNQLERSRRVVGKDRWVHGGAPRLSFAALVRVWLASCLLLFACGCAPGAGTRSASDLAAGLTTSLAAHDRTSFNASFDATDAARLDLLWDNLNQLAAVRFFVQDAKLAVEWRVVQDSASAWNYLAGLECATSGDCRLTDLAADPSKPAPIWTQQAITVQEDGPVAVLAAAEGPTWLEAASAARAAVQQRNLGELAADWDGQLVVEIPATQSAYTAVLGSPSGDYSGTGAITWVSDTALPSDCNDCVAARRIVVNPIGTAALSAPLRVWLLAHEATHVALIDRTPAPGLTWLSEGIAEDVGLANYADGQRAATQTAAAACVGGIPIPADNEFTTDLDESAYARAWVLVQLLRQRYPGDASAVFAELLSGGATEVLAQLSLDATQWCAAQ